MNGQPTPLVHRLHLPEWLSILHLRSQPSKRIRNSQDRLASRFQLPDHTAKLDASQNAPCTRTIVASSDITTPFYFDNAHRSLCCDRHSPPGKIAANFERTNPLGLLPQAVLPQKSDGTACRHLGRHLTVSSLHLGPLEGSENRRYRVDVSAIYCTMVSSDVLKSGVRCATETRT